MIVSKWHWMALKRKLSISGWEKGSPPVIFKVWIFAASNWDKIRSVSDELILFTSKEGEEPSKQCLQAKLQCLVIKKSTLSGLYAVYEERSLDILYFTNGPLKLFAITNKSKNSSFSMKW